jgi:hypothetical protein
MAEIEGGNPPGVSAGKDTVEEIELFLHVAGEKPSIVLATAEETLHEVLTRVSANLAQEGRHVFIGECQEALTEEIDVENGADEHATVDISLRLIELELPQHRHIHVHHCRHIAIEVNFGGGTKRHKFSPNTTVGVAADWARKKFRIDPSLAGEYVLQICNSSTQPRSDEHLGEVAPKGTCAICFDLVKENTPKG